MPDEECAAMDCDLPGRYTDPSLDGVMYCEHHRRRKMDFNQEQKIRDLEKERDHWKALAEKRSKEVRELAAEIRKMAEKLKQIQNMSRPGWGNR